MEVAVASEINTSDISRKQFFGTIFALQIIILLAALDQTVISTAMPHIVSQLGGFDRYAWATTGYLLTSTIAVPVLGKLSDLYGRKLILSSGVFIFVVASVLCGAAGEKFLGISSLIDGMNQLIVARTLQGIGGGAIVGLSFSVIGDLLPPATRGKYQGLFAAVFALASIVGPTVGGYVSDVSSWRYLFFINLPIGLIGLALFLLSFPERPITRSTEKIDFAGIVTFCLGSLSLLLGLNITPQGSLSTSSIIWLIGSVVSWSLFVWCERRAHQAFLPLFIFGNKSIMISAFSVAVTGVGMFGSTLLIPLFMQCVLGFSAAKSGLLLSPLIITVAVFSVVGGYWMSRSGKYKAVVLTGLSAMTAGVFLLSMMQMQSPVNLILGNMLFVGIGLGLLLPIYTVIIQNSVGDDLLGTVTGLSQFSRSMGGTLGVAGFGALMLFFYSGSLHDRLIRSSQNDLPPVVLQALNNPLASQHLQADLEVAIKNSREIRPENSDVISEQARSLALLSRQSLVNAIDSVFRLYGCLLLLALSLNLLLKDVPLRKTTAASSAQSPKNEQLNLDSMV